ncbi:MAG: PilT/PilU family type 4a pilus ATPase [Deltaproteobacteria bacterium]|nr:PilT/PilU family type 4a pilus ATPase [Deltaproteobacteria bacterium]
MSQPLGELLDRLRAPDADVRARAARSLAEMGGPLVLAPVSQLLLERGFPGVREALDVVVRLGGAQAIAMIEHVLTCPDPADRAAAVRLLADPSVVARAPQSAVRALAIAARDPAEPVAGAAITALALAAGEAEYLAAAVPLIDGKNLRLAAAALDGLKRFPSPRAGAILERRLLVGPQMLRFAALAVIECANADAFLGPLVKALGHPHLAIRTRAGEVMGAVAQSGKVEVGRTIVWLLRSTDVNVRRMAADVLRKIPDPAGELWPKLVSSLKDDDWWVRERVMDALVDLAGRSLSHYMVQWLADPSDVVRRFALTVLVRLRDPDTIAPLVQCALHDVDWWVREKAIEVIAEFKDARAVPTLVELMHRSPELQLACIAALKTIDPGSAAPHVLPLMQAADADVRLAALKVIEEQNDPAHTTAVELLLADEAPPVQRLASALIARWRVARRVEPGVPGTVPVEGGDATPLDTLLLRMVEMGGEDVIMAPDRPVFMKRRGQVLPITEQAVSGDRVAALLTPLLSTSQAQRLEAKKDVDFSYVEKTSGHRFRLNMFLARGGLSAVFHSVHGVVPALEKLALPNVVPSWCSAKNGLVLIAGPTASGKSTTLAALLDAMNTYTSRHIISIEDPIEFIHRPKLSLVNQREVGTHTRSFAAALRSALREDPDVLMIGEVRDRETIHLALTAAETGHLVFGTINTISSEQAIERIVNAFPRAQQEQARSSLADVLRGVLCQTLVRGRDGVSRHLACEVLVATEAVATLIRKGKSVTLSSLAGAGADAGMQSLENDLLRLIKAGLVDPEDAMAKVKNRRDIEGARDASSTTAKIRIS